MEMNHGLYAAFVEVMHVETNLCDPSVVGARMPCQLTHRVVCIDPIPRCPFSSCILQPNQLFVTRIFTASSAGHHGIVSALYLGNAV